MSNFSLFCIRCDFKNKVQDVIGAIVIVPNSAAMIPTSWSLPAKAYEHSAAGPSFAVRDHLGSNQAELLAVVAAINLASSNQHWLISVRKWGLRTGLRTLSFGDTEFPML